MKLYWCPQTRAFRISWLLEEAGVPFERVKIDIRDAAAKQEPAFRAVSPLGKVPALEDGPARLSDSGAICIYVADQYPQSRLGPAVGDPQRAAFLQWVTFMNSVVEPAMVEKFQKFPPNPLAHGYGSFDLMLATFRNGIADSGGDWILGERFSAADVLLGTGAWYLQRFGLVSDDPVLTAYVERCTRRPAFQRAQALETA
jgi:glutathione S-transferase